MYDEGNRTKLYFRAMSVYDEGNRTKLYFRTLSVYDEAVGHSVVYKGEDKSLSLVPMVTQAALVAYYKSW